MKRLPSVLSLLVLAAPHVFAQQQQLPVTQSSVPVQATVASDRVATAAPAAKPKAPFQLNELQRAFLDQVLRSWEQKSAGVNTFRCPFERWEYNAFGPANNAPHRKEKGELSYQKPDKGSFQITEISPWKAQPIPPGQQPPAQPQGTWVKDPNLIGEHWVCDGEAIYEYRQHEKQLVVRPIPPEMRGQALADGPLPFLFGAKADKLKARYWIRVHEQPNSEEIWLQVLPKYQADAANYRAVELILDRQQMLPKATRVHQPDGSKQVYMFTLESASVNGHIDRLMGVFKAPRKPFGWKRVVEQPPQQAPAQQPVQPMRQAQAPQAGVPAPQRR